MRRAQSKQLVLSGSVASRTGRDSRAAGTRVQLSSRCTGDGRVRRSRALLHSGFANSARRWPRNAREARPRPPRRPRPAPPLSPGAARPRSARPTPSSWRQPNGEEHHRPPGETRGRMERGGGSGWRTAVTAPAAWVTLPRAGLEHRNLSALQRDYAQGQVLTESVKEPFCNLLYH